MVILVEKQRVKATEEDNGRRLLLVQPQHEGKVAAVQRRVLGRAQPKEEERAARAVLRLLLLL